jgi:hypothetical protein
MMTKVVWFLGFIFDKIKPIKGVLFWSWEWLFMSFLFRRRKAWLRLMSLGMPLSVGFSPTRIYFSRSL